MPQMTKTIRMQAAIPSSSLALQSESHFQPPPPAPLPLERFRGRRPPPLPVPPVRPSLLRTVVRDVVRGTLSFPSMHPLDRPSGQTLPELRALRARLRPRGRN